MIYPFEQFYIYMRLPYYQFLTAFEISDDLLYKLSKAEIFKTAYEL